MDTTVGGSSVSVAKNGEENGQEAQHLLDQEQLVLQTIALYCNESSEFEDLRWIGAALANGDELLCTLIHGGRTNYPYKVYLRDNCNNNPQDKVVVLFAKLAFPYALWSLDRSVPYDLARTENEFNLMKRFSKLLQMTTATAATSPEDVEQEASPVATPYLCVDLPKGNNDIATKKAPCDSMGACR